MNTPRTPFSDRAWLAGQVAHIEAELRMMSDADRRRHVIYLIREGEPRDWRLALGRDGLHLTVGREPIERVYLYAPLHEIDNHHLHFALYTAKIANHPR